MGNTNNRTFSYNRGVRYGGNTYPSSNALLIDNNGQQRQGLIFTDNDSNYYTLLNGAPMPVTPVHTLDEVTVTAPKKHKRLSDAFGDYLTQSNDVTMVNNLLHGEYNTHLRDNAIKGAESHAAWEKEHPNLAAWSYAAGAVPFAVAATPFAAALGQGLINTSAGQAVRSGLTTLMANPIVDAANTGLGLGFAAKGAYDVSQGKFTPETALELSGLYPAITSGKKLYDTGALWDKYTTFQGRFGNYGDNLLTNMYGTYARRYGLPDKARLPADAIRKLKTDVRIDENGLIDLTGDKNWMGNPHMNATLDRGVVSHSSKNNWDGGDTYLFPTRDFIEKTQGSLKSIEPSSL